MIKIFSFVDGFKHYKEPIEEFLKRLWKGVNFIKLKPTNSKEIEKIVEQETKELLKVLDKTKWYKVLLLIEWKELTTTEFSLFLETKQAEFSDIIFIIWWAYWVDLDLLEKHIDFKLSFSKMTFPHVQAIMMLLEQIYRATSIKKGSGYHH
jgi:23S rRNA (pseudouridine1915-N3)-methyltransferase